MHLFFLQFRNWREIKEEKAMEEKYLVSIIGDFIWLISMEEKSLVSTTGDFIWQISKFWNLTTGQTWYFLPSIFYRTQKARIMKHSTSFYVPENHIIRTEIFTAEFHARGKEESDSP